jgi:5-methyltetrahydropteroyltriglutamate--homocysteine methyltransferase
MLTQNLGYPRVGSQRELKKAEEKFWGGTLSEEELLKTAQALRRQNWVTQHNAGIQLIPSNDFSLYDQVLDTCLWTGAIPDRYASLSEGDSSSQLTLYFAMARGIQQGGIDLGALEMTKWFDTNYHYLVPEFYRNQTFRPLSDKPIEEFEEARSIGILTKPVLLGPVTFLLLGKEKDEGLDRMDLLPNLLPVYLQMIAKLADRGAEWIQIDEPALVLDLTETQKQAYRVAFEAIRAAAPGIKILLATYFGGLEDNHDLVVSLPVDAIHIDLVRGGDQLVRFLSDDSFLKSDKCLSLGVIDGRNIWKNDFATSLDLISHAKEFLTNERIWLAPSCSLLHTPYDLDLETELLPELKDWMAFAKQKLEEIVTLAKLADDVRPWDGCPNYQENQRSIDSRRRSALIHKTSVQQRLASVADEDFARSLPFSERQPLQHAETTQPLFPTTTIGSFPQTEEVRKLRASFKKGTLLEDDYRKKIEAEITESIRWQEEIGMDVLVHGEFERNDMVEYFGEQLSGFAFTKNGWVQSYGSRCVKPPIIYGDVERPKPMTVNWSSFAQKQTSKPVKGMLTGPVTILQWSFVRNDQPRKDTAFQIALAIRDEVVDLEKAGISIIQIDEPAIREGLPLRRSAHAPYLKWAVEAFRLSASGVTDKTQIHTHMCYSEFNDTIEAIAAMDADVITIETSRSQMELLGAFSDFQYPNEIGPGVYDIHSPRIPSTEEIVALLEKALEVIPSKNLWINPDCGLKTRKWPETRAALERMIEAAKIVRKKYLKA